MEEIIITTTAESIEQVEELLDAGIDRIYVGEENYGLRLPHNFTYDELLEIAKLVHDAGKEPSIACNVLLHQDMIDAVRPYLDLLKDIKADYLVAGDAGVFHINKNEDYDFKMIYDVSVFVTSSHQVNFWGDHGTSEVVLAREIPSAELFKMLENLCYSAEVLVYGATVIHHSKRPLSQNYCNFMHNSDEKTRERGLFLAEPSNRNSHYSIFKNKHGVHIFDTDDLDMMPKLTESTDRNFTYWKLDGIYCPGHDSVEIVKCFVKVKELIEADEFTQDQAFLLNEEIHKLHPKSRTLETGFYEFDPEEAK